MHTGVCGVEDIRFSGTGVRGGCKTLCDCWEPNPSPLQQQQVLCVNSLSLLKLFPSIQFSYSMDVLLVPQNKEAN